MRRPENYNTKQQSAVLSYIAALGGGHATAAQIAAHFEHQPIGRTTIYRVLGKLVENGCVRKYTIDGVTGACYQYINAAADQRTLLHLKCEGCGQLFHLDCALFDKVRRHFYDEHVFQINIMKTVLYGKCAACLPAKEGQS
ncbi:MAG: transcriptional repressor [Clostridiales bacterium]|nr:transcriptional repressor [Clostridiales bacterium]